MASVLHRQQTHAVRVGDVVIGGGAPVVVQSMTDTPTADAATTADQVRALADAGAELVRITVNDEAAATAVPEIRRRLDDVGCAVPLIGDFHFNGHLLLRSVPACAETLAKFRINPGNVGRGDRGREHFAEICTIARDLATPIRIGVNTGSLDPGVLTAKMKDNAARMTKRSADEVLRESMVESALHSTEQALEHGLEPDQIVISCKVSRPLELIAAYRELADRTNQPLHVGLTEAGMADKGLVWSASAMAVLLAEGIGDTIRVSLTPAPGGDRCDEVVAAREILQALDLRRFTPSVTSCPGCGRTSNALFQDLAQRVESHIRRRMPQWREDHPGVERMTVAVMGCVVNGPGESQHADIGISLPGTGEEPKCPVYVDGHRVMTLQGTAEEISDAFLDVITRYVTTTFN
jgi:(E)-4-hydroxy-3-methylbut-2-enyl-diphosphate synthase